MAEIKNKIKIGEEFKEYVGYISREIFDEIYESFEGKKFTLSDGTKIIFVERLDDSGNPYQTAFVMSGNEKAKVAREVVEFTETATSLVFDVNARNNIEIDKATNAGVIDEVKAAAEACDFSAEREVEVERLVTFHMYKASAVLAKVDASGAATSDPMMWEIDTIKGKTKVGGKTEKSTIIAIARPDAPEQACFVLIKGKTRAEVQAEIDAGGLKDFAEVQAFGGVIIDHPIEKIIGSNAKYAALTYFPYTVVVGGKIDKTHHFWKWNKNNKIRTVKCPDATIGNTAAAFGDMSLQFTRIGQNARLKVNYHTALMKSGKFTLQYVSTRITATAFGLGVLAAAVAIPTTFAINNKNSADTAMTIVDDTTNQNQMLMAAYANPEHDQAYTYGGEQVIAGSKNAAVHNLDGQYYVSGMFSFANYQVYEQQGNTYKDENGKQVTVERTPEYVALAETIHNYTLDTEEGAGYAAGYVFAETCYGKVDGLARVVEGELVFNYDMVDKYLQGEQEHIKNYQATLEELHKGYADCITANFEKGKTGGDSVTTDEVDTNSDEALTAATVLTGDPDGIAYIITSGNDNVIYALDTPKEDLYEITLADHFGQTEYEAAIAKGEVTDQFKPTTTQLGITNPRLVETYANIYTSNLKLIDTEAYRLAGYTTNVFLTEDCAYKFVGGAYGTNNNGMQNYVQDLSRLSTASGIPQANEEQNLNIPTMSFYNLEGYEPVAFTVTIPNPEDERVH